MEAEWLSGGAVLSCASGALGGALLYLEIGASALGLPITAIVAGLPSKLGQPAIGCQGRQPNSPRLGYDLKRTAATLLGPLAGQLASSSSGRLTTAVLLSTPRRRTNVTPASETEQPSSRLARPAVPVR